MKMVMEEIIESQGVEKLVIYINDLMPEEYEQLLLWKGRVLERRNKGIVPKIMYTNKIEKDEIEDNIYNVVTIDTGETLGIIEFDEEDKIWYFRCEEPKNPYISWIHYSYNLRQIADFMDKLHIPSVVLGNG